MKPKSSLRNLILAAATLGLACSAHAAVIYFDDFTTGTNAALNGQNLITPSTTTWTANSNWNKNTGSGGAAVGGSNAMAVLDAPTFNLGDLIQITARVVNTSTSTGWVAIGFSNSTNTFQTASSGGRNWLAWRGNDNVQAFGSNASPIGTAIAAEGESNTLDLRMLYDVSADTMTWFFKDPSATSWTQLHTLTSATIGTGINHVAIGASTTGTQVLSFEVTNIPEPSTALLGGLGMLFLLRRRR